MDLNEFNEEFLEPWMEKLSTENKNIFLTGDFNVDFMKIDSDDNTSNYFDTFTSNLFIPHNLSNQNYHNKQNSN